MSSNPSVATVDGDGKVTARSVGKATITAISDHATAPPAKSPLLANGEAAEAQKAQPSARPVWSWCSSTMALQPYTAAHADQQRPFL